MKGYGEYVTFMLEIMSRKGIKEYNRYYSHNESNSLLKPNESSTFALFQLLSIIIFIPCLSDIISTCFNKGNTGHLLGLSFTGLVLDIFLL